MRSVAGDLTHTVGTELVEPMRGGGLFGIGAQFARGDQRFVSGENAGHRNAPLCFRWG